jgi:aminomethyltransferase
MPEPHEPPNHQVTEDERGAFAAPGPASPLLEIHRALGATFTGFAGWQMPLRYGSERAEHQAVRTSAGLFDLSHMGELSLTGLDTAAALDYALVGELSTLAVGGARYTMICAEDGGVIDDLVVYRLGDEHFLIVANASNVAVVASELSARFTGFGVRLDDQSNATALIALQGPLAETILAPLTTVTLPELRYYSVVAATVAGHDVLLARTGYTGEDGFELYVPNTGAPQLWQRLTEAGQPHGLVPAGLSCRDTLRLEAGMPLYGNELSTERTPFEAGLGRVVKFGKPGDFVGRKALEERRDSGPASLLTGLVASGRRVLRHGQSVLHTATGNVVGVVTSGAPSPTLDRPIAMAQLDPAYAEAGTPDLAVDVRGNAEKVEVVALPFYRRSR